MKAALEERAPCRPCPVDGCDHRILDADTGGRHLDRVHDEVGRWEANRYRAVDNVDGSDLVIFDVTDGKRWLQSDCYREVER